MTIQLSVFLWTIICFCLMMLILNKLLFGPMLRFMDDRQNRIQRAREKQVSDQHKLAEAQQAQQEALEENRRRQLSLNAAAVEQARLEGEKALQDAKIKQEQTLAAYAKTLEQESRELKTKLDAGVDVLAETFANRLVS